MLHVFQILFLTWINFLIVKCLIPDLSVQMLDQRIIQRKRQDTLEMCRLFNAETEKLRATTEINTSQIKGRRRPKRETSVKLSNKEVENARRVESIVDKLYEDLEENGEKVTYQKRKLDTLTTTPSNDLTNKTMRRFNFAPAELLGPILKKSENKTRDDSQPKGIDWPKKWKHGIVPYFIDPKTYDSQLADTIIKAFDYFEKATCIRLQKLKDKPTDEDSIQNVEWLYITNPSGIRQCVHSNERKENKGVQMVVFGYDCMSPGEIAHEVMHQLGFSHEHTRPDRDQYVTILWNNIKSGYKKYFELRPSDPLSSVPYDFASVLHYPPRAFSKNGQVTVMAKPGTKIGQREGLSDGDVEKVGIIFGTHCVERNRQYLLKTCPSVVKTDTTKKNVSQEEITEYFKDRLWPYGIVTYKLRDQMEFTAEERQNIQAVMRHIQKETCIQFRVVGDDVADVDTKPTDEPKLDILPDDNQPNTDIEGPSNDNKENNSPDLLTTTQTNIETTLSTVKGVHTDKDASRDEVVSLETSSPAMKLTQVTEVTTKLKQNDAENEISPQESDDPAAKKKLVDHTQLRKVKSQDLPLRNITPSKAKKTTKKFPRSQRRHAANILVLARSSEPGCTCPPPGRPNGNKVLHINADCFNSVNDLLHLFVHLLGLDHQHNMYDRDSYLHILWDNLTPDIKEEMKVTLPPPASVGFDYDYQSVMHYPWLQIKNGVTNIMYPIWNDGWAMGHWQGLSSTDVFKLNLIYYNQCLQRRKDTE